MLGTWAKEGFSGFTVDLMLWLAVTISNLWRISELILSFPILPGVGLWAPNSKDLDEWKKKKKRSDFTLFRSKIAYFHLRRYPTLTLLHLYAPLILYGLEQTIFCCCALISRRCSSRILPTRSFRFCPRSNPVGSKDKNIQTNISIRLFTWVLSL